MAHVRIEREVFSSVEALLAGASHRERFDPADGLSDARMERVVRDGSRYVAKWLRWDDDWIMRATGDWGCRPLALWRSGMLDALPDCIDHAVVAVAHEPASRTTVLLMADVGDYLVEDGPVALPQHGRFLDHLAALHAAFWAFEDRLGLCPPAVRYTALSPLTAEIESRRGTGGVPRLLGAGWRRLVEAAPRAGARAMALAADPWPLVAALAGTPTTFIHGDWKFGNLGSRPDGRTVLLDWAWSGPGPPTADVAWYLAVNCDRLPESKEATIAAYRAALERHGVATAGWFDRQLALALAGAFVQLGWSKADQPAELDWWLERVSPVLAELA
jgi:hypothetical protein